MSEKTPEFSTEMGPHIPEAQAAEMLQTEETFPAEMQEYLVSKVSDPNLSMYILGFDDSHNRNLTREQMEKLITQALTDREVVEIFHTTLTESGVEFNENEVWWFERVQKARGEE